MKKKKKITKTNNLGVRIQNKWYNLYENNCIAETQIFSSFQKEDIAQFETINYTESSPPPSKNCNEHNQHTSQLNRRALILSFPFFEHPTFPYDRDNPGTKSTDDNTKKKNWNELHIEI